MCMPTCVHVLEPGSGVMRTSVHGRSASGNVTAIIYMIIMHRVWRRCRNNCGFMTPVVMVVISTARH